MATLYENYITGDDASQGFYATLAWEAQTFTPSIDHIVSSVKVKLSKGAGTTGTITASIFDTDANDKPTGSALCSGTLDSSGVTTDAEGDWYEITFSTTELLLSGAIYALALKNSTDDPTKAMVWRRDGSDPSYTGGMRHTTADEGSTWTAYSDDDFMFEEWGDPEGSGSGGAIFPTNSLLRASGIKKTFWAGIGGQSVYQAELVLGGMGTTYVSPLGAREPPSAVKPEPNLKAAYDQWLNYYITNNLQGLIKTFGHIPTFEEWAQWIKQGQAPYFPKYF